MGVNAIVRAQFVHPGEIVRRLHRDLPDPYEEEIRRLRNDLYKARIAIIYLMPDDVQQLMMSYYVCESRRDAHAWLDRVTEEIMSRAKRLPPDQGSYLSDRAYCPLCKQGSSSPYESGFSLPEGLRRHLTGWGNVHQCTVVESAMNLARDHWNEKFSGAEQAAAIEEQKRIVSRRKSESLYQTAPDLDPKLRDEGIGYVGRPRTANEMAWAETRLADLGFAAACDNNVKSYIWENGQCAVYADPREYGRIEFTVFKKPLPKKSRVPRARSWALNCFRLMDSWTNDIRGKFQSRLAGACSKMVR